MSETVAERDGEYKKKRKAIIAMRVLNACFFGVLILFILAALTFIIADKCYLKGSLSFYIINRLITHNWGQIIVRIGTSLFFNSQTWVNILVTSVVAALLVTALILVNIFVINRLKHDKFVKTTVRTACRLFVYFCLSVCIATFSLSTVYTGYAEYVGKNFVVLDKDFNVKNFESVKNAVKESKRLAQGVIDSFLAEISEDADAMENFGDDDYIEIGETIALCFRIKGTVASRDEHYLRNHFYRAPKTLDDMIKDIKNKSVFGWKLLEQKDTVYHMQGPNGAYNVKFVSANGCHEAIYNKEGALLTEKNDPVNMGTFNYGDPINEPAVHAALDVLPYYWFGNCPASPVSSKENYDYKNNQDAQKYWRDLRALVSS